MKEFINKLIERLEELHNYSCFPSDYVSEEQEKVYVYFRKKLTEILKLAEEYDQTIDVAELVEKFGQKKVRSNDECEWNRNYQFISDKYKVETGCGYTFYDLHHAEPFTYCPYCGKRIAPYQPKGEWLWL